MSLVKTVATAIGAAALMATAVTATNLRIQTHYAPETVSGKLAAQYMEDINKMSNGEITVEMFYSSSVVKFGAEGASFRSVSMSSLRPFSSSSVS